jgi:uncharacterized membrane protein (DUF485 family)
MKLRIRLWYIIIFAIFFFCWYYALIFCSIYSKTSEAWLYGCLISMGIDIGIIQMSIQLVKSILRTLLKLYPNRCFVWLFNKYEVVTTFLAC